MKYERRVDAQSHEGMLMSVRQKGRPWHSSGERADVTSRFARIRVLPGNAAIVVNTRAASTAAAIF